MPNPLLQSDFTPRSDVYRQSLALTLYLGQLQGSFLDALAGHDVIEATLLPKQLTPNAQQGLPQPGYALVVDNQKVVLGKGNDTFSATGITTGISFEPLADADLVSTPANRSDLDAGVGKDVVIGIASGDSFGFSSIGVNLQANARVLLGAGNDLVRAQGNDYGLLMDNNPWYGSLVGYDGEILLDMGTGKDVIEATSASGYAVSTRNARIALGVGNDEFVATGANGFRFVDSIIDAGAGKDQLRTTATNMSLELLDGSSLLMGDGNDVVDCLSGFFRTTANGYVDLGSGKDRFRGFGDGLVRGGDGLDTLVLSDGRYTVSSTTNGFAVSSASGFLFLESMETVAGTTAAKGVNLMVGTLDVIGGVASFIG